MLALFSRDHLARTYGEPVAWLILAVDLFPIWAIFMLGWGAEPLVFLYWLENLIIGGVTLSRMFLAGRHSGPGGVAAVSALSLFFLVHYGLFCYVHGVFLHIFTAIGTAADPEFLGPFSLVDRALDSGTYMPIFIFAIIALQGLLFYRDYVLSGAYKSADLKQEMSAPYGRIIVLHVAIFAGVAAMIAWGEPLIGILGLLSLRIIWGVYLTVKRRLTLDSAAHKKS